MISVEALLAYGQNSEVEAVYQIMKDYTYNKDAYMESLKRIWSPDTIEQGLNIGLFNPMQLTKLALHSPVASGGVNMNMIKRILSNAVSYSLVTELPVAGDTTHCFEEARITSLEELGIIKNILVNRPEYLVQSYRPAVLSFHVEKKGKLTVGTGFVLAYPTSDGLQSFIVTNKHVVDPCKGILINEIFDGNNMPVATDRDGWLHHPTIDISVKPLNRLLDTNFRLSPFNIVLSEIITLGYPRVPNTRENYLLAHRGEINAAVESYFNKGSYIIISNATSPGNSGGPVIDQAGLVVGMVTEAFEGMRTEEGLEDIPEAQRWEKMQAALSSSEIYGYLNEITGQRK